MSVQIPKIKVQTDNQNSKQQLPDNHVFNGSACSAESWETDDSSTESDKKPPPTESKLPDLSESSSVDSDSDSNTDSNSDSESDETQAPKPIIAPIPAPVQASITAPANDLLNKMRQARETFEKRQSIIPEKAHPEEKLAAEDIVSELASKLNVLTIPKTQGKAFSKSPNRRKSTILKPSFEPKKFEMSKTKTTDLFIGEIQILDNKSDRKSVQNILPKPKSLIYERTTNEFTVPASLEIGTIRSITFGLNAKMFSDYSALKICGRLRSLAISLGQTNF